jgi:very-short-patch-repair endonuclease
MVRQRMDFLLLPSERARIVIEVDGKQHYADANDKASPSRYAEMVREDRAIRLRGYEVFRFGGAELAGAAGESLADKFFEDLLRGG